MSSKFPPTTPLRLMRLVSLGGLLCLVCSSAQAVGYGVNLIKNGDAEAGAFSSTGAPVAVPGWTTSSAFTVVNYGAPGGFPTASDPGPPNRHNQFFAGGSAATSTATQTIDVSPNASTIDTGKALVDLSGWLGGFENDGDSATLEVAFFNENTRLGGDSIGPVGAWDRNGTTGLFVKGKTIPVPVNTKRFVVMLTMKKDTGGQFNDGYADSLSLVLRVPVVVTNTEDEGPGTLRSAIKTGSVISFSRKVFAPAGAQHVITLNSSLVVTTDAVINGPGADVLTIKRSSAADTPEFQVVVIANFTGGKVPGPEVTISGLTIANGAGGIAMQDAVVVLNDCALVGNASADYGGGLLSLGAKLQVNRCLFAGNSNPFGGGAYIAGGNGAATVMNNCTFSGNTSGSGDPAGIGGLGVYSFISGAASVILHSCTFAGNSSAIAAHGDQGTSCEVALDNTILTKSTTAVNFTTTGKATVSSKGFNLSDLPDGAHLNQPGDRNSTDPKVGELQDNGGPTMTHALLPGSPAIDKGNTFLLTDQRGFGRPIDDPKSANGGGNNTDVGAFEFTLARRFQTEKLAVNAKTPAAAHIIIKDPKLSGGAGTLLSKTTVGSFVTYKVGVPGAGTYNVKVRVKTAPNRGTFQLAIEGVNIGSVQDEYSAGVKYQVRDLGQVRFENGGPTTFTFTVIGKNANSTGTSLAFDSIQLTPP